MRSYTKIVLLASTALSLTGFSNTASSNDDLYNAVIKASRTECASPCTVVFSAEDTTFEGMDEHDIFGRALAFHWDFDTDTNRTYGHLYDQEYKHVEGDTAFEVGHVPLVTKTFLCETDTCEYTVRVRAQDEDGNYADTSQLITVASESAQWSTSNTICVSNTLNTADDWSSYDKACPVGATQTNELPAAEEYGDNLVLLRRGDVWASSANPTDNDTSTNIATTQGASNYKIGYFGNTADPKPELDGTVWLGAEAVRPTNTTNAPVGINSYSSDAVVAAVGWPKDIYLDGIKLASISTPMSFQHITLHDLDMDREAYSTGGSINVARGSTYCHYNPDSLSCENVPYPKGFYISAVDLVGSAEMESSRISNISSTANCDMANYYGITDTRIQKTGEHHLRVAGFYRFNVMRSAFSVPR